MVSCLLSCLIVSFSIVLYSIFWIKEGTALNGSSCILPYDYFEYPAYYPAKVPDSGLVNGNDQKPPPGYLTSPSGSDDMATEGVFVKDFIKIWSPTAKDARFKACR
jgi:hypothetical protein